MNIFKNTRILKPNLKIHIHHETSVHLETHVDLETYSRNKRTHQETNAPEKHICLETDVSRNIHI